MDMCLGEQRAASVSPCFLLPCLKSPPCPLALGNQSLEQHFSTLSPSGFQDIPGATGENKVNGGPWLKTWGRGRPGEPQGGNEEPQLEKAEKPGSEKVWGDLLSALVLERDPRPGLQPQGGGEANCSS